MDDQKKKNGLICLLGRLGRRVKFLQKPLMVLVVLGVSIHHLLKKFFFDVNYHAARMRVMMGALCVALLFTLFVIPAIAGEEEFSLLDVVTEEIQTVPTEEPTPTPESEPTEIVNELQPVQGDGTAVPADGNVAPADNGVIIDNGVPTDNVVAPDQVVPVDGTGDGSVPTDTGVPVDPAIGDGTGYTEPLLNDNGEPVQPGDTVTGEDGETYEVDEEGNLIDSEGNVAETASTELLRKGPAVKVVKEPPVPVITRSPVWNGDITINADSVSYGDSITLEAHIEPAYHVNDDLGNGCKCVSSELRYIWGVKYGSNAVRYFWKNPTSGYETFTADRENFYSVDSGAERRFYGADESYVFSCMVKEYITYVYTDATGAQSDPQVVEGKSPDPDTRTKSVLIGKKEFGHSDFIFDSELDDTVNSVTISTNDGGNVFDKPVLVNADLYPELNGKYIFKYRFDGASTVTGENTGESSRTNSYQFIQEGNYNFYVVLEGESDKFAVKNESFGVVTMLCSHDPITDEDLTYDYQSGSIQTNVPVSVGGKSWVGGLSIGVKTGYLIGTDLDGYKKYVNPFVADEGGPASDAGYPAACPSNLHFSTQDHVKTDSELNPSYGSNMYIDKTGPEVEDGSLKFNSSNVVVDTSGTKYYVKGDSNIVGIEVSFKDVQADNSGGTSAPGSGVKYAEYRLKQDGGSWGEWKTLTSSGGKYTADDIDISGIAEKKGGVIEVRAIDNVGNSSESNPANENKNTIKFYMKDTQAPKFKVEMDEEEEGLPEAATEDDASVSTIYITQGRKVSLIVSDDASGVTKNSVVCPGGSAEDESSGGVDIVRVLYDSNIASTPQGERTVLIKAADNAGNESCVKVKFIMSSDSAYKADTSLITIPTAYYGYTDSGVAGEALKTKVEMFETPLQQDESISIKGGIVITLSDEDAGAGTVFEIPESEISRETGTFYIKPVTGLNVKKHVPTDADTGSPYTAVLQIDYTLYKTVSGVKSILDRHVVSRPVTFTVNPVQLKMSCNEITEYYHTHEYERNAATAKEWFEKNIKLSGWVNGETVAVLGGSYPAVKHENDAANTDLKLTAVSDGVLTDDGFIIGGGSLSFSLGEDVIAAEASNNFNYYYKAGTFTGSVTCIRREIKEGYTIKPTSNYNDEDDPETGRVAGNTEWYVEDMVIENVTDKYMLYDATVPKTGAGGLIDYEDLNGSDGFKVDTTTEDGSLESGTMFGDRTDNFRDPGDGSTVKKFYYVLNKETREISSQMIENIRIDTTNPGWDGNTDPSDSRVKKPYVPDGAVGEIDDNVHHPYFYIERNLWKEFLNTITGKMFFNDMMEVKVRCNKDKQSDIASTSIAITQTVYDDEMALSKDSSVEWDSFSGDASISKEKQNSGYIYIRITNKAGLSCYIRSEPFIVFDTDGPTISSNYEGENAVGEYKHTVSDGDEFIADEVKFQVTDNQALYCVSGAAVIPAVRVYKGTKISDETNVIKDKDIVIYDENVTTKEFTLPASDDWYTIVAKDNSGLVTTRYFKVSKPVYGLTLDTLEFNTETYGTPLKQSLAMKWKKTGNATPKITKVEVDDPGFTVTQGNGNEYMIGTGAGLDAGLHEGTITVTYNRDSTGSSTTTATGKCRITVRKKLLVASFEGGSIYKGQHITQRNGVVSGFVEGDRTISVSGFVGEDTAETAEGYVSPTITIPEYPSETMIVTPKGGSAKNYVFENSSNIGGVVTVLTDKAAKNTHYNVEGTLSSTGWYISNIKIKPKAGYNLTKDAAGTGATNEINIYDDTNAGEEKFYIKNASTTGEKAGEIFEQSVFSYKKDVVNPQITGVADGMTYQENKKTVTVKDDYLYRVAVNGVRQEVTNKKSEFDIMATQTQGTFFITAEDYAGHITTATISLLQPDGTTTDGSEISLLTEHPEDDIIQDDTEDGTDTDLGTLTRKVQLIDGAPPTTFTSTIGELKTGVLSSSERAVMREGSDANVKLRVQNVDGSVSQADKELVIAALGDYTVAQYLDITLWKTVGNGDEKQVTSTNDPISVTISIPDSFRSAKSGKVRKFAIVRVHNGSATVLQDKDSSANTITIGTSKFSVYALAYRDVDKSSSSGPGNASSGNNNNSGGGSSNGGSSGSGGSTGSSSTGSSGGSSGSSGSSGGSSGGGGGSYGVETGGTPARSVSTGDSTPIIPVAIGFGVAFIGLIAFIIIRRRMNYEWVYLGDDGKYYDKDGNVYEDGD